MNSNLTHTIGSNDAQILISDEEPRNFLHVHLQRYFGQMFRGSNKLIYVLVRHVLFVRCSFIMRRLSQDTILSKKPKMRCRVKKVCSEFESNLCNMITTLSKEVIFMKIHCVLIYLNRIIVEDPE